MIMIFAVVLYFLCLFDFAFLCVIFLYRSLVASLGYFKSQKSNYLQSYNSRLIRQVSIVLFVLT
jgi:hypothetical protein